eukprot:6179336-Pleurochrysis_carterae.AAC.2
MLFGNKAEMSRALGGAAALAPLNNRLYSGISAGAFKIINRSQKNSGPRMRNYEDTPYAKGHDVDISDPGYSSTVLQCSK